MRYLLVDQILEWQPGASIRGIKNVAMSEDFLEFHFPKNPVLPGVLLLEALTQLAGWLEAASSDFTHWFLIDRVVKSGFYGFSLPGDQVELAVELVSGTPDGRRSYRGSGTVRGRKKITVAFEGALTPLAELEDREEQRRFFAVLTRSQGK